MSRLISDILNAPEPQFSHALRDWEQRSGHASHDVRLVADMSQLKRRIIKDLGLDESDTTIQELYYALRHKGGKLNDVLEHKLGITKDTSTRELITIVSAFVDSLEVSRDSWVVKHAVIKELLKKQPPKKTMKALGLRSIDSVLKRSSSYELLALASQVEPPEWNRKILTQYKKLTLSDFQPIMSTIFTVESKKLERLQKAGFSRNHLIIPRYDTATVLLLEPSKRFPLDTLALILAVLQALYDIRVYSAYFRFISVKPSFGQHFFEAIGHGLPGGLHNNQIGWKALQKHFNKHPEQFYKIEQPHLHFEDVKLTPPLKALVIDIPDAALWVGSEYGFVQEKGKGGHPVSLHIADVVTNATNGFTYEQSLYGHGQSALWDELNHRYLLNEVIQDAVIRSLDDPSAV